MFNKSSYYYIVALIYENIDYYRNRINLSSDAKQKMFYESKLKNERNRLNYWKFWYYKNVNNINKTNNVEKQLAQEEQIINENSPKEKVLTISELAQYDGSFGRPAYVAINGIIYDVSLEAVWGGGTHFRLYAGNDLTDQFNQCHGGRLEILRNLPVVGILQE